MLSLRPLGLLCMILASEVKALNSAAPYELVYAYTAYKLEYATVSNPADRKLALKCTHKGSKVSIDRPPGAVEAAFIDSTVIAGLEGICSFKDFLISVGNPQWKKFDAPNPRDPNPTSISITLNPDVNAIDAQVRLQQALPGGDYHIDGRINMRPDALIRGAPQALQFPSMLSELSDIIQKARIAGADNAIVKAGAIHAVELLTTALQFRIGDNSRYFLPAIQAHPSWTTSPMNTFAKIDDVPYKNLAGEAIQGANNANTYQVIDYTTSFENAAAGGNAFSDEQKNALLAFAEGYGKGPPTPDYDGPDLEDLRAAKTHRDVNDIMKVARDLHQAPLGTGC